MLRSSVQFKDRVTGMLLGVALGDALGAPFQFRKSLHLKHYRGKLEHRPQVFRRMRQPMEHAVGQITDDTEMTMVLMRTLIENSMFLDAKTLTMGYMRWANSDTPYLGKNIRSLFKSITSYNGYLKRAEKVFAENSTNQSSGALMRCSPLALIEDEQLRRRMIEIDCSITNPYEICVEVNVVYTHALRLALLGTYTKQEIIKELLQKFCMSQATTDQSSSTSSSSTDPLASPASSNPSPSASSRSSSSSADSLVPPSPALSPLSSHYVSRPSPGSTSNAPVCDSVRNSLFAVESKRSRDVSIWKGWNIHALYLSLYSLLYYDTFEEAMDYTIRSGGDTDTCGAITGGLIGAFYGLEAMEANDVTRGNIETLLESKSDMPDFTESPRPAEYHPREIVRMVDSLPLHPTSDELDDGDMGRAAFSSSFSTSSQAPRVKLPEQETGFSIVPFGSDAPPKKLHVSTNGMVRVPKKGRGRGRGRPPKLLQQKEKKGEQ